MTKDSLKVGLDKHRARLKEAMSGDLPSNSVPGRLKFCSWHCGRSTRNISEICDRCWADREAILAARKAREAGPAKTKTVSPARKASLDKANAARMARSVEESLESSNEQSTKA
jgi:hypothetical protein